MQKLIIFALSIFTISFSKADHFEHKGCEIFKPVGPEEPSIIFSEAVGRLGNNLLLYALLYQLQVR